MRSEIYSGPGLQYITVVPDEYTEGSSYPLVIMLHGFGANMQDLAGLAPAINANGYVYACPNAPIPFNLGPGRTGFGWLTPRGGGSPEETAKSEALLGDFFDTVFEQFNVSPGQALLLGFSQGGGMTYRCGLGRADRFAGLAALSATLPDQDELATLPPILYRGPFMARLNQQEIDQFLGQPMIAHLVTLRPSGTPHVAPVWFLWADGRAFVMADANAVKVRNVKRNPLVALSIATPERPLSYVVLEGKAELKPEDLNRVVERMCVLYDGPERGAEFAKELLGEDRMVLLEISVDRVLSWKDGG